MRQYLSLGFFLLILWSKPLIGESQSVKSQKDSLLTALSKASSGEDRFKVLNELFKLTNTINFNESLKYAETFFDEATSAGDSIKMVQGGRMVAYSLMDLGRNDKAVEMFRKILGIAQRNKDTSTELKSQIKFILNNAGIAYMYLGNYDKSLEYHFQSLLIREEEGDKRSIRTALNNIGLVFYNVKDYDRSIENYLRALEISKELDDKSNLERLYINLGLCYNDIYKTNEAITYFNNGLTICDENCDENIIKEGLSGLGSAYYTNGEYEKAKQSLFKSLAISRKQNDKRYLSENLYYLGLVENKLENESAFIRYLNEAEKFAESSNIVKMKLLIYKEFADFYIGKKRYEESVLYLNKYSTFKDSVYTDQLIRNLARAQTNYAEHENLKTIREKDQILLLKEDIISRQERQNIFIVLIAVLVLALAGVSLFFSRRQQKINSELSNAKSKIEEQNMQLYGYNKELERKVEERTKDLNLSNQSLQKVNAELDNFIYKTSHDIRGPLATLRGMCNLAMVDVKDEMALSYLKKMDFTADRLNTILTRLSIINHINNSSLGPTAISFRDIIEEIIVTEKKKGIPDRFKINYNIEHGVILVSDRDLVKLVLENLVDNAIKFYNNSERVDPFVSISVSKGDQLVKILVEDNGIGIQNKEAEEVFQMFMRASERSESGGIGLYLAKLATEKLGGVISLDSTSDSGSRFLVLLPEDISLVLDSKSNNSQVLPNKLMNIRLQKKNFPSLFNS